MGNDMESVKSSNTKSIIPSWLKTKCGKNDIPMLFLIFVFLVSGLFQYIFYHTEIDMRTHSMETVDLEYKQNLWNTVESATLVANASAKESGMQISKELVQNIQDEHDMDQLRGRLNSGEAAESGFITSVHSTIRGKWLLNLKNTRNDIFVIYKEDTVIDSEINENGAVYTDIDSFIAKQYNPAVAEEAVQALVKNKASDIIFMEEAPPLHSDHKKSTAMNKAVLQDVVMNEGLDGLKGYEILIPTYITEDGDVFGTKDVAFDGSAAKNHKMILVQTYNLYDILSIYHANELNVLHSHRDHMKTEITNNIRFTNVSYLAILLMNMVAILLVLFYASKYKRES